MAFISDFALELRELAWYYSTAGYVPVVAALALGIIPALVWLWFWLKEDKHPEPRGMIMTAFIAGFAAVICTIPLQRFTGSIIPESATFAQLLVWSGIEEAMKFAWCMIFALRTRENNEPIDAVIYLVTTALGFAALENVLFIIHPLVDGHIIQGFITSNFRFIGASLLHVVASATIGVALALAYYRKYPVQIAAAIGGLGIAIILHTLFNFLIIQSNGTKTFLTFAAVWVGIAVLLGLFEKIKNIKPI